MAKRSRTGANGSVKNLKIWTILCLILVCIAAVALRGFVVYKLYPLEYKDDIKLISAEYSVDKYYVSAIICAESHFNAVAVSHQGAVGLMQIMPDTGEWAAKNIGIKNYTADMLSDPDINITIGCWYLGYLKDLFNGDIRMVTAAYNAGPSNVQEWMKNSGTLDNIPFEETQNYLETVLLNYDIYKGLYEDF